MLPEVELDAITVVGRELWALDLAYLVAAVLFILGIKGLTHPRTAVRGNMMSAMGMLIAIIATAFYVDLHWPMVLTAIAIGSVIGGVWASKVPMTAMPQMVAILNGLGGGASVFVAWAEFVKTHERMAFEVFPNPIYPLAPVSISNYVTMPGEAIFAGALAILIGTVTLIGSLLAFAKLQEIKQFKKPIVIPAHQTVNIVLLALCVLLLAWLLADDVGGGIWPLLLLTLVAAVLGFTLVSPIGGADMPVVIALLNSYSGLAAAATGFIIANNVLIITGSLVGASGIVLTAIMCKAMNRSLTNVLFGRIDPGSSVKGDDYEGRIKATTADEIAMMLDGAQRVVIVPGYGMAVAQAQSAVADLYQLLESKGVNVQFAIHPVAGRMPGHMNVLLAEVSIPYEKLVEMDAINPEFAQVDVVIVLGANDVVNPVAREANSPIAGMPILDVDKARTVVVVKRSLSPGFAGIPNPLFAGDNTLMYFADGKQAVMEIVAAVKSS